MGRQIVSTMYGIISLKDHFSFGVSLHCCRPIKSYVNSRLEPLSRLGAEGECMLFKDGLYSRTFFIRDQALEVEQKYNTFLG